MVLNLMNVNYLVNTLEIEVTKSNQIRVIFQKYLQGLVHPLSKQGGRNSQKSRFLHVQIGRAHV